MICNCKTTAHELSCPEHLVNKINKFKPIDFSINCSKCGYNLVEIRGRYPGKEKRMVCPCCLADKVELIEEICGKNYWEAEQTSL